MKKGYVIIISILLFGLLIALAISGAYTPARGDTSGTEAEEPTVGAEARMIDVPYITQGEEYPSGCEAVSAVMALRYAGVEIELDDFINIFLPKTGEPRIDNDDGVLMGEDPNEYYIGSPYSEFAYGCYSPVIIEAINGVLTGTRTGNDIYGFEAGPQINNGPDPGRDERRSAPGSATNDSIAAESIPDELPTYPGLSAVDLTGTSLSQLCTQYIDNGVPVIIWATIQMKPIDGTVTWLMESGEEFTWKSGEHCLLLVGYDDKCYYFNDPIEGKDTAYLRANVEAAYEELYCQAIAVVKE